MPILKSDFNPTIPFKNPHINTIYRAFHSKNKVNYSRERVITWDNDFIDLDFSFRNSTSLVLLIHGLEGDATSNYMLSTVSYLNKKGFDTVCMNLRGCSGEDNLNLETYHSGKTDDVDFIINHLVASHDYSNIILCGFSLGGNLILKYLGESQNIPSLVEGAIAVSVPVDLTTAQLELSKLKNKLYRLEFMKSLKRKILEKSKKHKEYCIDRSKLEKATQFVHIEELYTAPVFGFESPMDYYSKASSKPFIPKIKHKTLLINAKNDSFLSKECYPVEEAKASKNFYLLMPLYGGHVGFMSGFTLKNNWLERQIVSFVHEKLNIIPEKKQ